MLGSLNVRKVGLDCDEDKTHARRTSRRVIMISIPSLSKLTLSNQSTTDYQAIFRDTIKHVKERPDKYIDRSQFVFDLQQKTDLSPDQIYGQLNVQKSFDSLFFHFLFRTSEFSAPVPNRPALLLSASDGNLVGLSFSILKDDDNKINELIDLFARLFNTDISNKVSDRKEIVESLENVHPRCRANPEATRKQPLRDARKYIICNTLFKLEPTFDGMRISSSTKFDGYNNYRISWKTNTDQSNLAYFLAAKLMVATEESLKATSA